MDTKKAALVGLLGVAVGFVLGYGAGRSTIGALITPSSPDGERPAAQAPGAPLEAEANRPPAPESSLSISGTAVAATETSLTFDADLGAFDPNGQKDLPKRRTATLTSDTVIVRMVEKSPQELAADQATFAKAIEGYSGEGSPPTPPSNFKEVPMKAADIVAGDTVTVEAATDILAAETFTATRVTVVAAPSAPTQPPPPQPAADDQPPPTPSEP